METNTAHMSAEFRGLSKSVSGVSSTESFSSTTMDAVHVNATNNVEEESTITLPSSIDVGRAGNAPRQWTQLNGHTLQNGLLNLGLRKDDDGFALAPEKVQSISSYSSVSSPETLSPNRRTPDVPQVEFNDTQFSLVRGAEDLNIGNGDSSWILAGRQESIATDIGDEVSGITKSQDSFPNVSVAVTSSQFIFKQFGKGVPTSFTPSLISNSNTTTTTTDASPKTVQQDVSITPPAKRIKQLSFNIAHPSKVGSYQLKILNQPEEQHRARYLTEGSRGSVKDRSGSSYPTVQLLGYDKLVTLQVFIGSDSGKLKPHGFYQACKVYGKSANQFGEKVIDGTQVIEIQMDPEADMKVCVDCVGILKLRNADVEARIGALRSKKRSNRARLVFRVQVSNPDGGLITLQAASQPILCTQPVGQPEICRMSLTHAPYTGGMDLYIIGKNFLKGSKVIFRETNANEDTVWEKEATIDPDFFQQMHIICTVPSYDHERLTSPRSTSVLVNSAGRYSEGYRFTYMTGPQQQSTQTLPWQTLTVPEMSSINSGSELVTRKQVIKMETDSIHLHQVNMDTNTALPPASLYPKATIATLTIPQRSRAVSGLDEDSPTGSKPGMLMDSDPMVSSTISMSVTLPNPPVPFPLVTGSSNDMTPWVESSCHTPSKSVDVYADGNKTSESWTTESNDTKMEVSNETYKTEDQWQNQQWTKEKLSVSQWPAAGSSSTQWTTEDNSILQWRAADSLETRWKSPNTETLSVEVPVKTDVWSDSAQNYGQENELSVFQNTWNPVIESTNNSAQSWSSTFTSADPAQQSSSTVKFTPTQCSPEMALAPKEFTYQQGRDQTTNDRDNEPVNPVVAEKQRTLVLRDKHDGQPVLVTDKEIVQPYADDVTRGATVISRAIQTTVAEYSVAEPIVFSIAKQGSPTLNSPTNSALTTTHLTKPSTQITNSTLPVGIGTDSYRLLDPTTHVSESLQTTVPFLIPSQMTKPDGYVFLTDSQVPTHVQVITAPRTPSQSQHNATETSQSSFPTIQTEFDKGSSPFQCRKGTSFPTPFATDKAGQETSNCTDDPSTSCGSVEVKRGLSGGTLPTISLEEVCHILRD